MSTKLVINKDYNYRILLSNHRLENRISKLYNTDFYIPIEFRSVFCTTKSKTVNKLTCKTRNRCLITGRTRAVHTYLKLTRMMFKNMAVKGSIAGLKKYSW
jgi:succinate dehydrogenase (ubiquinone) iron-sulfur subunit